MKIKLLIDNIAQILLEPISKVVTAILGVYTLVWGAWVANPLAETFNSAPLYNALLNFVPYELFWGLFAVVAGIAVLVGVKEKFALQGYWGAAIASVFWFIIAIFYFIGDVSSTGGVAAVFSAVLGAYIYLNCKVNYVKDHEDAEILHLEES